MNALHTGDERSPAQIDRRRFILATLSLAVVELTGGALAQAASSAAVAGSDTAKSLFMQVSKLVSTKAVNIVTADALYVALRHSDPAFDANLLALARRMSGKPDFTVETLAADLDRDAQPALRATLNSIVSAWYLGVVGDRTYAYESALMFRSVDDVLSPPSYTRGAPLYWAASNNLPSA
jgi:hypothetical protein